MASTSEITEITTGLGVIGPDLDSAFRRMPNELRNVPSSVWDALVDAYSSGERRALFEHAFDNGRFLSDASDGLRGRPPVLVEWSGRHRVPGDDAIPADLRVDRVYLVSCKYLSRVVLNSGPVRLFDRGLIGDARSRVDWFLEVAPDEYQGFYEAAVASSGLNDLPPVVGALGRSDRAALRDALRERALPDSCRAPWRELCDAVAVNSARRWRDSVGRGRPRLELLWRMVRVSSATYFVLGAAPSSSLRLRVGSKWDWLQEFELVELLIEPRESGQPEVGWEAVVRRRDGGDLVEVKGHVEVRWSHGRFNGLPEAKVYLDTPHDAVPGYYPLGDHPDGDLTLL